VAAGSIRDLLVAQRGVITTPRINRDAIQAAAADSVVMRQDPSRVAWLVVNLGTFDVFLAPLAAASPTRGVRLSANGGFASAQWDEDGEVVAHEWHAVGNGGASALYIQEAVIEPRRREQPA
jgi:hypothetical protein